MAQANVAREPSMDEILASIRRIIESNDPPTAGSSMMASDDYNDDETDEGDIHLTIDEEHALSQGGFQPASEKHIPSFPLQGRFQQEETAQVEAPPLSLADVAARVRAASERNSGMREPEPQETRQAVAQPSQRPFSDSPTMTARMGIPPVAAKPVSAPSMLTAVTAPPEVETARVEPQPIAVVEEKVEAPLPSVDAMARQSVAVIAEKEVASLVSPVVSQQVARSFESLAVAIDEGQRRSFDEIAEEMMRPMLQEWLDDNLPTLVERLVREEIERVARGPRR